LSTINQRVTQVYKRPLRNKRPKFNKSPQRKAVILRLRICTPRKPNSARRPAVKVFLTTKKKALAHIPGSGHNLKKHSRVLLSGHGARDVPVVNYTCIRGIFDFEPLSSKRRRRSIYGVKQLPELRTHIRRKLRNLEFVSIKFI
jgi:small subunit ribosomal protein S12